MENKIISIVSGGFDPVHPGHIMMMKDCLDFSDYLVVGVNSNQWLINKKGNFFMDIKHRLYVINSLAAVNEAIEFEDDSKGSASNLLIDVRKKSPTFGKWFSLELNDEKSNQFWVPPGFAHGFQVLSDFGIINYKCSLNYWSQNDEKIVLFNDPDINVKWPIKVNKVSEKDKKGLPLKQIKNLPDN